MFTSSIKIDYFTEKLKENAAVCQFMDTLLKRRSCRRFDTSMIPREDLEKIVSAARNYPSGKGHQDHELYVVTNKAKLDEIGALILRDGNEKIRNLITERVSHHGLHNGVFCDAPVVIFCNLNRDPTPMISEVNQGCVSMSVIAAAESLGYGTLPLMMTTFNPQRADTARILGIPEDHVGMAIAIGRPHSEWRPLPKEIKSSVVWIE